MSEDLRNFVLMCGDKPYLDLSGVDWLANPSSHHVESWENLLKWEACKLHNKFVEPCKCPITRAFYQSLISYNFRADKGLTDKEKFIEYIHRLCTGYIESRLKGDYAECPTNTSMPIELKIIMNNFIFAKLVT